MRTATTGQQQRMRFFVHELSSLRLRHLSMANQQARSICFTINTSLFPECRVIYSPRQRRPSDDLRGSTQGINVGGHKLIKMKELARIFTDAGLKNVRTYIASGNVIFESGSANKAALNQEDRKGTAPDARL